MAQWKSKNKQKIWHSPLALGAIFLILIIFAYNMIGLIEKDVDTSRRKNLEQENIAALRQRQTELSSNIAKLSTDEGIEESIRAKYQVAKPGEDVVTIVDQQPPVPQSSPTPPPHGLWASIKRFFHLGAL